LWELLFTLRVIVITSLLAGSVKSSQTVEMVHMIAGAPQEWHCDSKYLLLELVVLGSWGLFRLFLWFITIVRSMGYFTFTFHHIFSLGRRFWKSQVEGTDSRHGRIHQWH
jgi:hypothetical protein